VTGWRRAAAAALASLVAPVALVVGTPDPVGADPGGAPDVARSRPVLTWQDRRITESSGLADGGRVLFTVNDSGDGPVVYAAAKRTGRTRSATTYSEGDVTDVEALAPGRDGSLWVADTGDNEHERETVAVYHLPRMGRLPERVSASRFELDYPEGSPDAEALLADPRSGRLYVVTKSVLGGTVYRAPEPLRAGAVNRLEPVARVPGVVTDGAFLPDGGHVLLRTYTSLSVFTFPGWERVGTTRLPRQRQGEGLAVSRSGEIYLSTEGAYSQVLQVFLPDELVAELGRHGASLPATPSPAPAAGTNRDPASPPRSTGEGGGIWIAGGVTVATLAGWLVFTAVRPRSRRNR
jgi:hypothetical protein